MKNLFVKILIGLLLSNSFLVAFDKKDIRFLKTFKEASKIYAVELRLLLAIAKSESEFNPKAINKNAKGSIDRGIMQVNSWWIEKLRKYDRKANIEQALYDPHYNIKVGAWILQQCVRKFGHTWRAVDCYNKGAKKARSSSRYVYTVWENYKKIPNDL